MPIRYSKVFATQGPLQIELTLRAFILETFPMFLGYIRCRATIYYPGALAPDFAK
jgi:hypothetical protein